MNLHGPVNLYNQSNAVVKCKHFYIGLVIILVFATLKMSQLSMKYLLRQDLSHRGFVF